jgi:Plant transposon protein
MLGRKRPYIERSFGVLQRKFHILVIPVEYWYTSEIKDIVLTCILLHNMMVDNRVENDQNEAADFYTPAAANDPMDTDRRDEDEIMQMFRERANNDRHTALHQLFHHGNTIDHRGLAQARLDRELPIDHQVRHKRWQALTDKTMHLILQDAITKQVAGNIED